MIWMYDIHDRRISIGGPHGTTLLSISMCVFSSKNPSISRFETGSPWSDFWFKTPADEKWVKSQLMEINRGMYQLRGISNVIHGYEFNWLTMANQFMDITIAIRHIFLSVYPFIIPIAPLSTYFNQWIENFVASCEFSNCLLPGKIIVPNQWWLEPAIQPQPPLIFALVQHSPLASA